MPDNLPFRLADPLLLVLLLVLPLGWLAHRSLNRRRSVRSETPIASHTSRRLTALRLRFVYSIAMATTGSRLVGRQSGVSRSSHSRTRWASVSKNPSAIGSLADRRIGQRAA